MISNYEQVSLGDHCDLFTGFAFKSAEFRTGNDGEVRLARGDNIKEGYFEWGEKEKRWTSVTPDLTRYLLRKGDILVGMDGSKVGKNWVEVSESDLPCLLVQRVCCFRAKRTLHQRLLRYFVSGKTFKSYIDAVKTGTSIPHISMGQIRNFMIPLIPMPQQKAIAHILGTLDDKIELNQKMNETLEDIAKAIFKSWFIDFDPVRAKAEGRPTGLPAEISDLFPDAFEDSEIGEIPAGWALQPLGKISDKIESGGTPSRKIAEYWEGGAIPWYKTGEFADGPLLNSEEHITETGFTRSAVKAWGPRTILFAMYGATVGKMSFLTAKGTANQAVAGISAKDNIGFPFVWNTLLHERARIMTLANGAAQQNLNLGIIKDFPVKVPGFNLAHAFSSLVDPIYERIVLLKRESTILSELRDTLLPKLISGELRIPDAEKFLEEAGV